MTPLTNSGSAYGRRSKNERMSDPRVKEVQARVKLIGDPQFAAQERKRPGLVRVHLADGRTVEELVPVVRGTADNPMTREEVRVKCQDLFQDVLGKERAASLIEKVWALEKVQSMRELRPLLSA